jgi:cob(I)alamin adenosyltransferase
MGVFQRPTVRPQGILRAENAGRGPWLSSQAVRIYTKTGDDGTTGLLFGGRISKADAAAEAYGTVDESVAALGLARAFAIDVDVQSLILKLQRGLFVVGADLATNPDERHRLQGGVSLVDADMVAELESTIDRLVADHPLPREFIVPGANPVSAALDLARGTVRRAERRSVEMRDAGRPVNEHAMRYLNRLSDLLFVMARWQAGGPEEPSRER